MVFLFHIVTYPTSIIHKQLFFIQLHSVSFHYPISSISFIISISSISFIISISSISFIISNSSISFIISTSINQPINYRDSLSTWLFHCPLLKSRIACVLIAFQLEEVPHILGNSEEPTKYDLPKHCEVSIHSACEKESKSRWTNI